MTILPYTSACPENVNKAKEKYKAVQKEIKSKKSKLVQAGKKEKKTLVELHETNKQLNRISKDFRKYRDRMRKTNIKTRKVEADMEALGGKIDKSKSWLEKKLRAMHMYGKYEDIMLVLGASEDFSQVIRRWRYLEVLSKHERGRLEELGKDLGTLKSKRARLKSLYARLKKNEEKIRYTADILSKKKEKKQSILSSVRSRKVAYKKMLKDLNVASRKLRKVVDDSGRESVSYAGKDFRKRKGRLPWPVKGQIAINYGTQNDPEFNTPVFRNGVYIIAEDSSVVKASHAGKVVFADWFKGYGQLVILNHGEGYHTLYANLSEIFLKTGDIINIRENIGKVGDTGLLNRPSLYFEIRYKGKPLNPKQWLFSKSK
jgi:septal ring factor EnvC (AmiA/AmiB activator)